MLKVARRRRRPRHLHGLHLVSTVADRGTRTESGSRDLLIFKRAGRTRAASPKEEDDDGVALEEDRRGVRGESGGGRGRTGKPCDGRGWLPRGFGLMGFGGFVCLAT